jgi:hypothetical protein
MGSSKKKRMLHKLVSTSFVISHIVVIRKHGSNSTTLHFLKTSLKRPNMLNPYEKLSRACLWEWFITSGDLKPNYKDAMEVGITMKSKKKSMYTLGDYLKVCDSLVVMLQKMNEVG